MSDTQTKHAALDWPFNSRVQKGICTEGGPRAVIITTLVLEDQIAQLPPILADSARAALSPSSTEEQA